MAVSTSTLRCLILGPVQIIGVTQFGVQSAVIRLRRKDTPLQFVVYPMVHMAKPTFYADVTNRLRNAQVVVVEGVGRGASGRHPSWPPHSR
jgi:hypothetical protein